MANKFHNTESLEQSSATITAMALSIADGSVWEWDIDTKPVALPDADVTSQLRKAANAAYENDQPLDETICITVDGAIKKFRIVASRKNAADNGPRVMLGVCLQVYDTCSFMEQVLNKLPSPICVQDSLGRYLYVNQPFLDMLSLEFSQLAGRFAHQVTTNKQGLAALHAIDAQKPQKQTVQSAVTEHDNHDIAIDHRIFQVQRFCLTDAAHLPNCIVSILHNIDALRSLEQNIQQMNTQGRQLFDAMPVLILYFDAQRKLKLVNRKVEKVFNDESDKLRGKTLPEILPDWPPVNDIHRKLGEVVETGKPIRRIECTYRQDDTDYWAKIELFPVHDLEGEIENILMLVSDVSTLYKHKEKLAEQDARARAMMANSFESMYCLAIEPPLPMSLDNKGRVEWFLKYGYYYDCNQKCADSMDLTMEQLIDRRFIDVVGHGSQLVRVLEYAAAHDFSFDNHVFEFYHGGRKVWWEYSIRPNIKGGHLQQFWGSSRDITAAKLKAIELQDNEARYRSFIANSHEAIFHGKLYKPLPLTMKADAIVEAVINNMVITECNDEFLRQHGNHAREDILEKLYRDVESSSAVSSIISRFVHNDFQLSRFPIQLTNSEGKQTWSSITLVGLISGNALLGCWGTQRDITERYHYLQRLEHQANHDSLTKLPNRQKLYAELERHLATASEDDVLALILLDLDRFKEINDTLGHHIGDLLLKELGPRLQVIVNQMHGMVARLGGDEFAIMLPHVKDGDVKEIALRLFDAVNPAFNLEGFHAEVKASIGIALSPKHASDVSGLMRYADIAMYQAKNEALGVLEYDPSLDSYTPRRLSLMNDLGRAIREQQLVLYYQPKIDVSGKFVRGFEALLRWNHPEHGFLPPVEFITLAESTENIRPLTLWVLDAALAQCRIWRDKKLDIKMAVNLSARNLLDESIVDYIRQALLKHQVPANALELEITESAIMLDPKRAADVMRAMGELGVNLSIDDYGTGYSSLAYLKSLPVDTLKIDFSFVKDMLVEKHDAIIVHSTINLAHNLGLKVVAEGVENEAILIELDTMGCDLAQGYHVARPMPADEVENWLSESGWSSLRLF